MTPFSKGSALQSPVPSTHRLPAAGTMGAQHALSVTQRSRDAPSRVEGPQQQVVRQRGMNLCTEDTNVTHQLQVEMLPRDGAMGMN